MGMMRDEYHYLVGSLGFRELALDQYRPSGVRITGFELASGIIQNRSDQSIHSEREMQQQQRQLNQQTQFDSILSTDSDTPAQVSGLYFINHLYYSSRFIELFRVI